MYIHKKSMAKDNQINIRVNTEVKVAFTAATYYNGVDVTETLEQFMKVYIKATNDAKEAAGD